MLILFVSIPMFFGMSPRVRRKTRLEVTWPHGFSALHLAAQLGEDGGSPVFDHVPVDITTTVYAAFEHPSKEERKPQIAP